MHRPYASQKESQTQTNGTNGGDDSDEDGGTIMGRASNIANTAKDLLGALWYGANDQRNNNGLRRQGSHS
jgi:hypothetical protein